MSKGKMNWYQRAKDEYAWRNGVEDHAVDGIPAVEDGDVATGVRSETLERCPLCDSKYLPSYLEKHIHDRHGVDMHCDPFHFFNGSGESGSRQLFSLTTEELDRLFNNKASEQTLQALMIELAERTVNVAKKMAADVISKYLELKHINYFVHFDNRVFEIRSIRPPGKINAAKSFADVMLQFKHMFRKNLRKISETGRTEHVEKVKEAASIVIEDRSAGNSFADCGESNQMKEEIASQPGVVFPQDFTEAGLSAFHGKPSIDVSKLTVNKTDKGTYCISLVDAQCCNVLCSSSRWDAAFAICEKYTRLGINKASEKELLRQVSLFDSRKIITGQELKLFIHSRGVDIELQSSDGAREVIARNAAAIASRAVVDYLLSARYEQYLKKNSVKRF
ncbi:MAG: hypothetical protein CVV41_16265 [Candidatus Riflebacteria bacterium HGW-Riflebacteria-1]|jgi:hypothetical protein|nr:MAG: hypothetical protein CVV41_16265 [Candidatus Riflebacteria bacterium HGW-Riflebacteria-1]